MREFKNYYGAALSGAALFLVFGCLSVTSFIQQSPTIDEPVHLLGGYSYLKWHDFRVNPEHPPLAKIWAALPLLALSVADPRSSSPMWKQLLQTEPGGPVYPLSEEMFFKWSDAATLFFYAKLQMILLSVVLGLFVYLWSREFFGPFAALVSLLLYVLDPNILAHSSIIHTDLPFAATLFIGCYFFCRAQNELTWLNLSLVCLLFGMAATTKDSFIAIVPIWLSLATIKIFRAEPITCNLLDRAQVASSPKQKALVFAGMFCAAAITGYFCIWAAYGFRFAAVPGGESPLYLTPILARNSFIHSVQTLMIDHHLFPEAFVGGYLYNFKILPHAAYLLGEISPDGFWGYFPIVFAVKTPLPTMFLLAATVVVLLHGHGSKAYLGLALPPLIYFILAIWSRFNLGIRHLLPVYPFLFVLIGGTVDRLWREGSWLKRNLLVLLGLWSIWSALSTYPHFLAYFNELAGGPESGHKWLLDSNLDWGQDLKGLKGWMDDQGVKKIQLVYFGTAAPEYYGIDDYYSKENLAGWNEPASGEVDLPQYLAVSANFLYGGELYLPKHLATLFNRYSQRQPDASIGYSLQIFKLDLSDARVYEDAATIAAEAGAANMATALLRRSLRLDPANATAYFRLGGLMASQGKLDDAAKYYRAAIKVRPDFAESYHNLGRILNAQGHIDEAVKNYNEALRIRPEFADVHQSLGQALARLGKVEEAARHYQEALRILKQRSPQK
jgi:tetratricopeptide (TPR) repeat protein